MASGGSDEQGRAARLRPALGETIIGAGALVLAIVMFWQTMSIPVSPIYAKVGPDRRSDHHGALPGDAGDPRC